ncbi:MAG: OmpP1/FadL family transporter, partial [Gammaproteobacteria bacterium]
WEAGSLLGVVQVDLRRPATAGATTAGEYPAKDTHPIIPYAAFAHRRSDRMVIGFSLEASHGLSSEWPDHTFDLNLGPAGTADLAQTAELQVLRFGPALALKVNDQWSFGARLFGQYVEAKEENDISKVKGDGTSVGAQIGARYAAGDVVVGAAYSTRTNTEVKGSLSDIHPIVGASLVAGDAKADILLPARLQTGVAFRLTPSVWWELDLDWIEWSYVDELTIRQSNSTVANAGKNERHNKNTLSVRTAIKWTYSPTITLYAGLGYDPSPTAEEDAQPTSGMVRKTRLGLGVTRQLASGTKIEAAYQFVRGHSRRIDETSQDNIRPTDPDTNLFEGTYESRSHILGLNLVMAF